MAKVSMKERKEKLSALLATIVGSTLTESHVEDIKGIFGSQAVSAKMNDKGEVFCNYFGKYLPEDQFIVSSKGKIDSMSKDGKRLHRTQKSMVNRANNEVLKQFKAGEIDATEMAELLAEIEANASYRFPEGTEAIPENYPFEV